MTVQATYLGMPMAIDELDVENLAYFKHCAEIGRASCRERVLVAV